VITVSGLSGWTPASPSPSSIWDSATIPTATEAAAPPSHAAAFSTIRRYGVVTTPPWHTVP
jgi:hypothetical protein